MHLIFAIILLACIHAILMYTFYTGCKDLQETKEYNFQLRLEVAELERSLKETKPNLDRPLKGD